MQKYWNTVTDRSGKAIQGASIAVTTYPAGSAATLYSDDGVTPTANPVTTDASGYFEFYAADGRYTLSVSGAGLNPYTLHDVMLEDPADDAASVRAELDIRIPEIGTYALLEAYAGPVTAFYVVCRDNIFDGAHGVFRVVEGDATTPADGGVWLVDALGRRWRREINGEINVAWFVSAADAGDIALATRRALAAADGGAVVVLPPGNYTASTTAQMGDLTDVNFRADGATVTMLADVPFLRAAPPEWEAVQTSSAMTGTDLWGPRKTVTVADGSAYAVGDLVKLVSDDKQRGTRPAPGDGTDYRIGWMAYVEAVSGNTVTIDRPCPWSLTTNSRIARMPRRKYAISGGTYGYQAGHETSPGTGWRSVPFVMYGVSDLTMDVEIEHAYNAAISLIGCFEPVIRARGRDLRNDESNQQYGYLVNDSSYFSRVDIVAGRNRHGYTTNMPLVAAASDSFELYGATYGALVTGQSNGNSQAGFDTHHGSENITFNGCVSQGGTTGGGQFVLRGIGHKLIHPVAQNGKEGIYVYTEAGVSEQTDVEIIDASCDVDRYPLVVDTASRVTLRDGAYRSRGYGKTIKACGTLILRGAIDVRTGGANEVDGFRAITLTDCTVDARNASMIIDMQDVPGGASQWGAVTGGGTANSWNGGTVQTINDSGMTAAFYKEGATPCSWAPKKIVTQKLGNNYLINCEVTGAGGVGFAGPWVWEPESALGRSGYMQITVTAGYVLPLLGRGDAAVLARLFASSNITLGAIPAGAFVGQILAISATTSGGSTITVPHGASYNTSLTGGANIVLSAEQGLSLAWNGTRWTPCA